VSLDVEGAGYWGDYHCDLPARTMQSMFDYIDDNIDELGVDFITWLGDNGAHSLWKYSKEETAEYSKNVTLSLKESLKKHPQVEVYPVFGNHDTWPADMYDFS
jgi:sphingomyelin phosphodiesterase